MDEIRLPQHVVDRIDRRFTLRFAQMLESRGRKEAMSLRRAEVPTPVRHPRARRLLEEVRR